MRCKSTYYTAIYQRVESHVAFSDVDDAAGKSYSLLAPIYAANVSKNLIPAIIVIIITIRQFFKDIFKIWILSIKPHRYIAKYKSSSNDIMRGYKFGC